MNLVHIKLKNGEDLIGVHDIESSEKSRDGIWIVHPISVDIHPIHGLFGKSWMLLSDGNTVKINNGDIMFMAKASSKASYWYKEFMTNNEETEAQRNLDKRIEELEEMYNTLQESKQSIKH